MITMQINPHNEDIIKENKRLTALLNSVDHSKSREQIKTKVSWLLQSLWITDITKI